MVKKANNKKQATQAHAPTLKPIKFPSLSDKSHVQCLTFLEDQILLLSVRL